MRIDDTTREYYAKVDAGDTEWIVAMFAKEARYRRADADYVGQAAIAEFYREGRKIRGKHTIENLYATGNVVVVQGTFVGQGAKGNPKKVRFCDVWLFQDTCVKLRETYLALGSDYVRE